jgi:hypothetical protein
MIATNDRFLVLEFSRIDQSPSQSVLERHFALVGLRPTILHQLAHVLEAFPCCLDNTVNAVDGSWAFPQEFGMFGSKLNEMLKVMVTRADKLEAVLDLAGNSVELGRQDGYLAKAVNGTTHYGQ